MMLRTPLALLTALVFVAACGSKATPDEGAETQISSTGDSIPKTPHVSMIQIGTIVDSVGFIPAVRGSFLVGDTIKVSIETMHAGMGAKVSARILMGDKEIASKEGTLGEPNADGIARILFVFPPSPTWALGSYQVEATLDGTPQTRATFTVEKPLGS